MAFLPITFLIYWIARRLGLFRVSLCILTVASILFYSYQSVGFGIILVASVLVNYTIYRLFDAVSKYQKKITIRKLLFIAGLIYNFGILFYFKYLNFFALNMATLLSKINGEAGNNILQSDFLSKSIILPLGISFYTFQQVSFLVDAYHNKIRDYKFYEYSLFVCFFPQLIAGPIVLHDEMIPQFRQFDSKVPRLEDIYDGLQYFIIGLCKKLLIADVFGRGVDYGYDNILWLNSTSAVLLILSYTLQIYFDFSGYCDMAIGLGRLFGFKITTNFDSPYKSLSVSEFWKRWHITLTRFFTTYLYIPLGGNRKGRIRTYINVMIVFTLSGLWHGSGWTFILWGLLHGIMMVIERALGKDRLDKLPKAIRFLYTFLFVNFAWVFFRATTIEDALNIFKRVIHGGLGPIIQGMKEAFVNDSSAAVLGRAGTDYLANSAVQGVLVVLFVFVSLYLATRHVNTKQIVESKNIKTIYVVTLGILFVCSVIAISGVSTFLYFNF